MMKTERELLSDFCYKFRLVPYVVLMFASLYYGAYEVTAIAAGAMILDTNISN